MPRRDGLPATYRLDVARKEAVHLLGNAVAPPVVAPPVVAAVMQA